MNNTDQQETGTAPPLLRQNQLCCCRQSNSQRRPLCRGEDRRLWLAEAGGRDHLYKKPKINKSWLFNIIFLCVRVCVWYMLMRVSCLLPSTQKNAFFWMSPSSALVTSRMTSWNVVFCMARISSSVNNLRESSRYLARNTFYVYSSDQIDMFVFYVIITRNFPTHFVCSQTRSDQHSLCVQTGPGWWQKTLDLVLHVFLEGHPQTALVWRCRSHITLQAPLTTEKQWKVI